MATETKTLTPEQRAARAYEAMKRRLAELSADPNTASAAAHWAPVVEELSK